MAAARVAVLIVYSDEVGVVVKDRSSLTRHSPLFFLSDNFVHCRKVTPGRLLFIKATTNFLSETEQTSTTLSMRGS